MIECQETSIHLLIAHQQFAKAVEPTVRHLDNPPSSLLPRFVLEFFGFLAAPLDVGDIAVLLNDFQRRCTGITRISAQMFVSPFGRIGSFDGYAIQDCFQLCDIMPICSGHDER